MNDASETVFLSTNLREFGQFFSHNPEIQARAKLLGLTSVTFLAKRIFEFLFRPSFFLANQVLNAKQVLEIGSRKEEEHEALSPSGKSKVLHQPFLGIHFRAGNESSWWDPSRHSLDSINSFLDCAKRVEADLFGTTFGNQVLNLPWFLSTDTARVLENPEVKKLMLSNKLRILPSTKEGGIGHVDRSKSVTRLNGVVPAYVGYELLREAEAIVMSRSWFGETAAETGQSGRNAYFGDGCVRTDLSGS